MICNLCASLFLSFTVCPSRRKKWNVSIFIDNIAMNLIFHTIYSYSFQPQLGFAGRCQFIFCFFSLVVRPNHIRMADEAQ